MVSNTPSHAWLGYLYGTADWGEGEGVCLLPIPSSRGLLLEMTLKNQAVLDSPEIQREKWLLLTFIMTKLDYPWGHQLGISYT